MPKSALLALLILTSLGVSAGPVSKPTEAVFAGVREQLPKMCAGPSALRTCFGVSKEICESRVNATFEGCLRDEKISLIGQASLDAKSASAAEQDLKACVMKGYSALSMSSYRKSASCDAQMPKAAKPVAA